MEKREIEEKRQYLKPIYENVKSYYKKAYTKETIERIFEGGLCVCIRSLEIKLYSYDTLIIKAYPNKEGGRWLYDIYNASLISATTLRHIKEFLYQFGLIPGKNKPNKKQVFENAQNVKYYY